MILPTARAAPRLSGGGGDVAVRRDAPGGNAPDDGQDAGGEG